MSTLLTSLITLCSLFTQNIDKNWTLQQSRGYDKITSQIPGSVQGTLLQHGLIPDPFFGTNERTIQWVDKEDWIYQTTFNVNKEVITKENIDLCLDGIDTYADVYLNDSLILNTNNMFRQYRVDVKNILKDKNNILKVYLHSPIKKGIELFDAVPFQYYAGNDQSQNGGVFNKQVSIFTRKAPYQYGWDWGCRIVTLGIWRPIKIEAWNNARLENIYYKQTTITPKIAKVDVELNIISTTDMQGVDVQIKANKQSVGIGKFNLQKGQNKIVVPIQIKQPKLWWPLGSGDAYLYNFNAELSYNNKVLITDNQNIGLRSIELIQEKDNDGTSFYFKVNGKPIFMKGANYIPQDLLLERVSNIKYENIIKTAASCNMNMLRVWGGGIYENDIFYTLCDKYGILVWQDFMFACSLYPATKNFCNNIELEAKDNIIRLRNHPCIALWCGNNECNDAWYGWGLKGKNTKAGHIEWDKLIEHQLDTMYYEVLPKAVKQWDPMAIYTPSSPYAPKGGRGTANNGDYHFWLPWHARKPIAEFQNHKARFMSEYGFQSFPTLATIKTFAPDSSAWRIDSDLLMYHQRGGNFANDRICQALKEDYYLPTKFDDLLYLSQVVQADAIKSAIEAHRRAKPYCWGSLYWQINDCWPVASWSSMDYYGTWKALQYYTRPAFNNLLISPQIKDKDIDFYLVNDLFTSVKGNLQILVENFEGKILSSYNIKCSVPENCSKIIKSLNIDKLLNGATKNDVFIYSKFTSNKGECSNINFLVKDKYLNLPKTNIDYTIQQTEDGYSVTLKSNKFAKAVYISIGEVGEHFSDNFFNLLPNTAKTITIKTNISKDVFAKQLKIKQEA